MRSSNRDTGGFEYGIRCSTDGKVHRNGMTLEEAKQWLDGWLVDGGREGAFSLIRRSISKWEPVMQSIYPSVALSLFKTTIPPKSAKEATCPDYRFYC